MRLLREIIRKVKYKIKFLGRIRENFFYLSNSQTNNTLTDLMNKYGSDKGGLNNHHNYSNYYSEIFNLKKNSVKYFLEIKNDQVLLNIKFFLLVIILYG